MSHTHHVRKHFASAHSASIYGPVRSMRPSLYQQWREVARTVVDTSWAKGSLITIAIITLIATAGAML